MLQSTGIVRRLDELGRVVLPIELRRSFDWKDHDKIEIFTEDDRIVLKKYEQDCLFCGSSENLKTFRGKLICPECLRQLSSLTD